MLMIYLIYGVGAVKVDIFAATSATKVTAQAT
jgi:hypothetical protein